MVTDLYLSGEYKVRLPDGRIQVTSYEADDYGYRPTITYEYPHHKKVDNELKRVRK